LIGWFLARAPLWQALALALPVGLGYVVLMRPLVDTLPLPENLRTRLRTFHLVRRGGHSHHTAPFGTAAELVPLRQD
jgi:hypothetical protein